MFIKTGQIFGVFIIMFVTACNSIQPNKLQYLPEYNSALIKAYVNTCGQCHAIPHPARHSYEEWGHVLVAMNKRMQERGYQEPSQASRNQINIYLKKHARK
ncbi:MAG: hypothetical protein GXP13_03375 [Gammaproteobacteria bacterium]|nr:hypothetical protein [Gammaproteobacteria bacterium]